MMNKTKEKKVGFLETRASDGMIEKSSKRLAGLTFCVIGVCINVSAAYVSSYRQLADANTIITVGNTFIIAGSSLLGIGVLEGIGNKQ